MQRKDNALMLFQLMKKRRKTVHILNKPILPEDFPYCGSCCSYKYSIFTFYQLHKTLIIREAVTNQLVENHIEVSVLRCCTNLVCQSNAYVNSNGYI